MFEDYLLDANYFYNEGIRHEDPKIQKRYFRVSIFCIASSIESFINYIGNSFEIADSIDKNEVAFLNDKVIEVHPSKGKLVERAKFNSIEEKIKFLINKFNSDVKIGNDSNWDNFINLKILRDKLIHSREIDDVIEIEVYKNIIKKGLNSVIYIINKISISIFRNPLRKKLQDLIID